MMVYQSNQWSAHNLVWKVKSFLSGRQAQIVRTNFVHNWRNPLLPWFTPVQLYNQHRLDILNFDKIIVQLHLPVPV